MGNLPFFHCLLSLDDAVIAPRIDVFNALFEHNEPTLFSKFEAQCISPKEYLLDWAISLFTKKLSIAVASRVWDIVLLFGEMEVYRCSVAVLQCLHRELLRIKIQTQNDDEDHILIRKLLKTLPPKLKEGELIAAMKSVKV